MVLFRQLIIFLVLCSGLTAFSQEYLIPYPTRDPQIPLLRAQKVRMIRSLEVRQDSAGWKPTRCDYWDTSYFTYSKNGVRKLFIAYEPLEFNDAFNKHRCSAVAEPSTTIRGKNGNPDETLWDSTEVASDTTIYTYDNDGYLLSKIMKPHSGATAKNEFWYLDSTKQLIAESEYDHFGFKDSTFYQYDDRGRMRLQRFRSRVPKRDSGVLIHGMRFQYQSYSRQWIYDSLGRPVYQLFDRAGRNDTSVLSVPDVPDSVLYDRSGKKVGYVHYSFNKLDSSKSWSTHIDGKRTGYLQKDRKGRVKSEITQTVDSLGNELQMLATGESGIIQKIEYRYDENGLRTDAFAYRNNYQDKTVRLLRHMRYLYKY